MTVKELKKELENLPDNMDVMLRQTDDESAFNMVNSAEVKEITFHDQDIPEKEWVKVKCFVVTDGF